MRRWRRINFVQFCSWLGRASRHTPGPRLCTCSSLLGSIDGGMGWLSNMACATGSPVPSARRVVAFWSRKALCRILTQPSRIAIFGAANVAALRLEQLAGVSASRIGSRPSLTAREIAVLRLVSTGGRTQDIARALGLGEETVRSHLKKAESKLGVSNRTHAACEALRRDLIP